MVDRDLGYLLDIPIDKKNIDLAVKDALVAITGKKSRVIFSCANPHSLVVAQRDKLFRSALTNSTLVVADGVGIMLVSKLLGLKIGSRITGNDYYTKVLTELDRQGGGRVFFFGSTEKVLTNIRERLNRDFPNIMCCGAISPPFGEWSYGLNETMVKQINDSKPDVLWVGMTAPKQEKWVEMNKDKLDVPVIGSIGAVFDFYAGTAPRAPEIICKYGFEWLYRLVKEPVRMWKRNFLSTPLFLMLVLRKHVLAIQ